MNYSAEYSCTRAGIGDILRDGIAGSVGWSVFNWIRLLSKAVIPGLCSHPQCIRISDVGTLPKAGGCTVAS